MRTVDPTLDAISLRLATADYATAEERDQLVAEILPMATRDNSIMLLVDTQSFQAFNANIQTAYDLAANLAAGSQWAYTMRWKGQEGGTIRIAQGDLMVEPWNPIGGSNWVDDGMIQRATIDSGFMYDPYTGLIWPNMAESFKLVVEESRPVFQSDVSTGWASVEKVADGSITVPADAWYDWDPTTGKWITVGEAFPEGTTAITLGIVTYPADLYTTVTWHDGTPFSAADVVMNIFMTFAQCKPESPLYDESIVSNCESWFSHFKGVRITSVDPLVIETYDDLFTTDAELNATSWWPAEAGAYGYGGGSWSMMALGNIMEASGETAYTSAKSETLAVERVGFLTGPTLEILNAKLDACIADSASCIEYPEVFGQFVTTEQAATAFANLKAFYTTYGHMWIGTGPYFIDGVFPTEKVVTLKQNTAYPFLSDRWSNFGAPKIAVVEIEGDAQVTIGSEAVYDVYVTFEGEPYPASDIASVNWLLFNSAGELAGKAPATLVEDGHYQVTLSADVTGALAAGANKLEIAVGSKLVALPGLGALEFVTVAP
jgi:peptide/nickel transport system substrate-binding protein